jgi:hypothetical protein
MRVLRYPRYRRVVFRDASTGAAFLARSARRSSERIVWEDGRGYPLVHGDIELRTLFAVDAGQSDSPSAHNPRGAAGRVSRSPVLYHFRRYTPENESDGSTL